MRKIGFLQFQWAATFVSAVLCTTAFGDTIILKSGEKIDGVITSETAQDYTIEFHASASITDTRKVAKTDVDKIEKEQPDEKAYQTAKLLKVGPNSMPAASYEQMVTTLQAFVNNFPKSAHVEEIQKNLDALRDEKQRVDGGEIKLEERWISHEEAQKERVQLTGLALFKYMNDLSRGGDLVGAMNTFTQLEKAAAGSRSYPEAVELAKQILPNLKARAERNLQTWKYQKAEQEKGIQLLSGTDRTATIAATQREQKQADAAFEASTKAGLAFPPLMPPSEKGLTAISTKAVEVQKHLATVNVDKMHQSMALTDTARDAFDHGSLQDASAGLKEAQKLWPTNELAMRLSGQVSSAITKAAAAAAAAATPQPVAAPRATPRPAPIQTSAAEPVQEAPKSGFFSGPAGVVAGIIAIVLILGGFTVYRKVAARANEAVQ